MSEKPISPLTKQILITLKRLRRYFAHVSLEAFAYILLGAFRSRSPFFSDEGWLFAREILRLRSSGLSHHQVGLVPASPGERGVKPSLPTVRLREIL